MQSFIYSIIPTFVHSSIHSFISASLDGEYAKPLFFPRLPASFPSDFIESAIFEAAFFVQALLGRGTNAAPPPA